MYARGRTLGKIKIEWWIFGIALVVNVLFLLLQKVNEGRFFPELAGTDADRFIPWMELFLENPVEFFRQNISSPWYWGYSILLGVVKIVFQNVYGVVLIQILVHSASVVLLFKIVVEMEGDVRCAVLCALWYCLLFDVISWNRFVLSDSLGLSLLIFNLYAYIKLMQAPFKSRERAIRWLILILTMSLIFIERANAVDCLVPLTIFLLLNSRRPKRNASVIAALIVIVLVFLFAVPSNGHGLVDRVDKYVVEFLQGDIMLNRSFSVNQEHLGTPLILVDLLCILGLRIAYFWAPFLKDYSKLHILLGVVQTLPTIVIGVCGAIFVVKKRLKRYYIFVGVIASYWVIQSLTEIDYSYRYRAPIFSSLCVLGTAVLMNIYKTRKEKECVP